MKKLLLCTTALFGLASFSAQAGSDVQVSFSGSSTFEAGYVKDKTHDGFTYSPNQKSSALYTMNKAALKVEGKSESVTYGAVLNLNLKANNDTSDSNFGRSYVYMDTDAGSVQLGSNVSASKMLKIDAGTIASATGGVDGDWSNFAEVSYVETLNDVKYTDITNLVIGGVDTLANRIDNQNGESSRKITYLSPRISGLQLAVSFAPDMQNSGTGSANNLMYLGRSVSVKNLVSLGLNFTHTMNDVVIGLSATGDKAKNNNMAGDKLNNLQTYALGLSLASKGFSFAASYQNDGKSLTSKNADTEDKGFKADWWTVGLAYGQDAWSTSLTYLQGNKGTKGNKVKNKQISLGADYQVFPGMTTFAEVTGLKAEDSESHKSTVFMLGTKLKF